MHKRHSLGEVLIGDELCGVHDWLVQFAHRVWEEQQQQWRPVRQQSRGCAPGDGAPQHATWRQQGATSSKYVNNKSYAF
eukprot:2946135-Pleurochrysis_carterae.AAC.2